MLKGSNAKQEISDGDGRLTRNNPPLQRGRSSRKITRMKMELWRSQVDRRVLLTVVGCVDVHAQTSRGRFLEAHLGGAVRAHCMQATECLNGLNWRRGTKQGGKVVEFFLIPADKYMR